MMHIARGNASRTSTRIPSTSSPPLLTANLPVAIRRSALASRRRESHPDHDELVLLKRERHDEMAKQTLQWLFLVVGQELQDCACFCLSFFRLKMHEVYAAASVHNPPVLWRTLHVNLRRLTRLTSSQHESWSVAMTQKATHHASQAQICAFHLLINTKSKYLLVQGSVCPRRWFTWPVFPCPEMGLVRPEAVCCLQPLVVFLYVRHGKTGHVNHRSGERAPMAITPLKKRERKVLSERKGMMSLREGGFY